jgi:hypothetical protein
MANQFQGLFPKGDSEPLAVGVWMKKKGSLQDANCLLHVSR